MRFTSFTGAGSRLRIRKRSGKFPSGERGPDGGFKSGISILENPCKLLIKLFDSHDVGNLLEREH